MTVGRVLRVVIEREQLATYRSGRMVRSPDDVLAVCAEMAVMDREQFMALHLDPGRRLIAKEVLAIGTLSSTIVTPREVFKGAMLNNSAALILVHNHPSGDPTPSFEDQEITRRLSSVGEILGVPVLDHIVVAAQGWRSMQLLCEREKVGSRNNS